MKKVVHIQYSMESAGRAALRLYHTFNAANLQTSIVTLHNSQSALPGVVTMGKIARLVARLDDKIQEHLTRHTDKQMGSFSYPVLGSNLARLDAVKKADIFEFYSRLAEHNPAPRTELEYGNDYQLLVAVVLSAQATDKGLQLAAELVGVDRVLEMAFEEACASVAAQTGCKVFRGSPES